MSQPPYSGPPYPDQPHQGEPHSGQPWSGQPNPDVPTSVPPQPGFPPYGQQPGYPAPGEPAQPQYGQPDPTQAFGQPVYGQPQYGQPGGQPAAYGQPQYGQPGYGQPGYGQPEYAQAGAFPPPQPPKKSKALPIVLIAVAAFLVLCVGGGTAIYIAVRNTADDVNESLNSPDPTTGATAEPTEPTADATKAPTSTITVVEPKTLGGRPKLTDPQFASLATELKSGLSDVPDATNTVGALYGTVAKRNIVVVAAAAAPIDDPAKELDSTFSSAGIGGLKITGITTVKAGALGGQAKCGKATEDGLNMAICTWADDGSLGMVIFFFQSVTKAKTEFAKLRAQVEKKST
jgi:hypothetical protein